MSAVWDGEQVMSEGKSFQIHAPATASTWLSVYRLLQIYLRKSKIPCKSLPSEHKHMYHAIKIDAFINRWHVGQWQKSVVNVMQVWLAIRRFPAVWCHHATVVCMARGGDMAGKGTAPSGTSQPVSTARWMPHHPFSPSTPHLFYPTRDCVKPMRQPPLQ